MALKDPVVARDDTIRSVILGVIVLAAVATLLFSQRALLIGARGWVLEGAALAPGKAPPNFTRILDEYGVHMGKLRHTEMALLRTPRPGAPLPDVAAGVVPDMHFGYSVVETSILGAPYWVRKDDGYVIYYETPDEFVYAPVTDDYLRQVKIDGPRPLSSQSFAWWAHVWGWWFPLALAGWGWFELGAMRRRREAEGII